MNASGPSIISAWGTFIVDVLSFAKSHIMAAFANPQQLQRHFSQHGNEFGAATAIEYEAMASEFLTGPMATTSVNTDARKETPSGFARLRMHTESWIPATLSAPFINQSPVRPSWTSYGGPRRGLQDVATIMRATCYIFSGTVPDGEHMPSMRLRDGRPSR